MESTRSSGAGSGNSGTYTPEVAETLRFEEEIQSLMRESLVHHGLESPQANGGNSSFTALLDLPPSQAVELLHKQDPGDTTADPAAYGGEMWRFKALRAPSGCSPTFPSNAALVERAARFSVFAAEDSPPPKPKAEPADSDSFPICPIQGEGPLRPAKRKEAERSKARAPAKKSRSSEKDDTGGDKLPYVHVRARRGQATDSHSLAERARREKINARMKLLQELVPGCSKITGTALVLDEIINHVQSLQRQVEVRPDPMLATTFLSMRLAAVNPRIDFTGLDSFISAECGRMMGLEQPLFWSEGSPAVAGGRRQHFWHGRQGSVEWERDETTPHVFINPSTSLFGYDPAAPASLPNQLKTQL